MGPGRKTRTLPLKGNSEVARNLTKNRLGAVIFGCKHHTIKECSDKKIFGLPAAHYSYVKNITRGLTLFLFNYTDRKLHGIFEAMSNGQMNIDRYAWITSEGAESTPYPAQVQVKQRRECRSLLEEEFKPIIAKNYYTERLFWFELDKEQSERLIKLFLSSPLPKKMPHPPNAARFENTFDLLSRLDVDEAENDKFKELDSQEYPGMAEMIKLEENEESYASIIVNTDAFTPEKKWADLFKKSSSYSGQNGRSLESQEVRLNSSDCTDMDWEFASSSHKMSKLPPEACPDAANTDCDSNVEEHDLFDDYAKEIYENTVTFLQYHDGDDSRPDLTDVSSSEDRTCLEGESGELKPLDFESQAAEAYGEAVIDTAAKLRSCNALASGENCEIGHNLSNLPDGAFLESNIATPQGVHVNMKSSDFESVITKLMQEIEGLKISQLTQRLKIDSLENGLVQSKLEIDKLKKQCHKLESLPSSACDHCDVEQESVLIVGGFDGCSWLPDLSSYHPSQDHVISLCPMTFSRSYASVAKLNDELYIFGGFHDDVWYNTVESYNPMINQWVPRPPLNKKKGSLAGASMYEKIFAIGGGNGVECFSEVELFDLNIGRWIFTQSMLEKRFAPAASDMNGALYVAGGYDGRDYLRSVERFDPREHVWARLGSMNSKRGCHSLVAFNEKLYALGGYDGEAMVSTVEVFDPRVGSWMMEEPMIVSRGHFGSFVFGGKMYVIGGVEEREVLDVVECYDENSGWQQVTGMKALGKRCFFSTLVL